MVFGRRFAMGMMMMAALALAVPPAIGQTQGGEADVKRKARIGKRHKQGKRAMRSGDRWLRRINLTEAQREQMRQLREGFRERTRSLHEQLRAGQQALRQAQQGDSFNEALAQQRLMEMAGVRAKLMAEQFQLRQQMRSLLTAEQIQQLEQMRANRSAMKEQRKARRAARRAERRQQ